MSTWVARTNTTAAQPIAPHTDVAALIELLLRAHLASGSEHHALPEVLRGCLELSEAELAWVAFVAGSDDDARARLGSLQLACCIAIDGGSPTFDQAALMDAEAPWSVVLRSGGSLVRSAISTIDGHGHRVRFDSFLGMPIPGSRDVVGVMGLFNRRRGFDAASSSVLAPLCTAIGVTREAQRARTDLLALQQLAERRTVEAVAAADKERLRAVHLETQLHVLRRREGEAAQVSEATEYVAASRSLREAVRIIAAFLPAIFGEHAPQLLVPRTQSRAATPGDPRMPGDSDDGTTTTTARDVEGETVRPGDGDCRSIDEKDCWALKTGQAFFSEARSLRCRHLAPGDAPWLCVPLVDGARSVAVLSMSLPADSGPSRPLMHDERQRRVASLSDQARQFSNVLANLRLRKTLEEQATQDPLTGALNRRQLDHELRITLHRHQRTHEPFALFVIDVDHFKQINDQFGHERGDRVLRGLAHLLRSRLRTSDVLARVGGEEFVVVVRDAQRDDTLALAEALRAAVENARLAGDGVPCTCSIGVAHVARLEGNLDDVMRRADQALYQAKTTGRNRIVSLPADASGSGSRIDRAMSAIAFPGSTEVHSIDTGRSSA